MDTLSGSVERITFYNPENGYTVLRLRPENQKGIHAAPKSSLSVDGLTTVVGNLPEVSPGEFLQLQGQWSRHPTHGSQFKAEVCEQTLPATITGIQGYLGSGMIKGIGPKLAERIVGKFKEDTFDVIEQTPGRLLEVPGIGMDRTDKITKAWQEQKQVKEIMVFLHGHGVSTNLAVKIYKTYGDQSLEIVQQNPYQLERDIYGVGFKTADKLARALGLPVDHPSRIEAGIVFALNEMINNGHVFVPRETLGQRAVELLEVPTDLISPALDRLAQEDRIRADMVPLNHRPLEKGKPAVGEAAGLYNSSVIYLTPLYFGEKGVADRLKALASSFSTARVMNLALFADEQLSDEQRSGIEMALTHPVSVLTGGPGTGKTTCLKALITTLETQGMKYALASPTGRAAKRLSEATGRAARTIHRLLEYSPMEGFKHNDENPLDVDFLIVDEASMLDLLLTNNLLKAVQPGTRVLFVGDVDQLPSVGAGDVLRDLIDSKIVPVMRLKTIYRQAAHSMIITNAHRINQGKFPDFPKGGNEGDFFLFPAEDAAAAADWIIQIVTERIPQKFGFDAIHDIQVMAPIYRGPAGVIALNDRLQEKLNPAAYNKPERRLFGTVFRLGDKVMQTQNNYDKDIYNGDIGFIRSIDITEQNLTVHFDGRTAVFDWSEADQISLAYVISVHKAQGSEFPVVVMPIVTQHYTMLQRNLLYTGITRARQLCVLAGSRRAVRMAVQNNKVTQRFTALEWRLTQDQGMI
jgi:exodeoxyribonuclease V alpha subunit